LGSPFCLDDDGTFLRWREKKLHAYPKSMDELIVEVKDPKNLSEAERDEITLRYARANMVLYTSRFDAEDREIPRRMAQQFGVSLLDANWLADPDAISSIQVRDDVPRLQHIPYSDRPIRWHTDGYYNPPERSIRTMLLHCVRDAQEGGENALLDHEVAYLLLRDESPDLVRALCAPDAMTIPARWEDDQVARPNQTGPVFSTDPESGRLHMRYTARTNSIQWRDDDLTLAAVASLESILTGKNPGVGELILTAKLKPGMGLVCANVLHTRSGFVNDPARPRLLYRARYYDALQFQRLN